MRRTAIGEQFTALRPLSGFGKRAAIDSRRFLRSAQLSNQIARAFFRLFARYRYKLSGDKLVCGPECNHPMT